LKNREFFPSVSEFLPYLLAIKMLQEKTIPNIFV
jgi:hypothetical protein